MIAKRDSYYTLQVRAFDSRDLYDACALFESIFYSRLKVPNESIIMIFEVSFVIVRV